MDPSSKDPAVQALERLFQELEAQGKESVLVRELSAYVKALPPNADRSYDIWKATVPLDFASQLETWKSVLESGQTALKTFITINGGAAVALLAFLGNLLTKAPPAGTIFPVEVLSRAMLYFVGGVASGAASMGLRYFTQFFALRDAREKLAEKHTARTRTALNVPPTSETVKRYERLASVCVTLAWLAGLGSLGAFCWGGWKAYRALHG
jgi:hypothetical protein